MNSQGYKLIADYLKHGNPLYLFDKCYEACVRWVDVGPDDQEPFYVIYVFSDSSAVTCDLLSGRFRFTSSFDEAQQIIIQEQQLILEPQELH